MFRKDNSETQVFVAMSGGVDSSVAAALLVQQGYQVTGVFMKNWSGDDFGIQADCPWEQDQADALAVCEQLGIPFRSFNFEAEYRQRVVDYFFSEYRRGRTPNPDIMCNREIKFDLFWGKAFELGANMMATGHYARVVSNKEGEHSLLRGVDPQKDQTYFLYTLNQDQLARTLFPIGHLKKSELREVAKKMGLKTASKPDSQGICFIGEINVYKFLRANIPTKQGEICDVDTQQVVGEHDGAWFYTIGQREGLRIGGKPLPYFVVGKDIEQNVVYVGQGADHPGLYSREVNLESLHLISRDHIGTLDLEAVVRYRQQPAVGKLDIEKLKFIFDTPQRAVTSGQSLVLYKGEECVGGGVIV